MDKIEKYKRQASRRLVSLILVGTMAFGFIFWYIQRDHPELAILPLLALLLVHYTDYTALKAKIELLEELNKKTV